MVSEGLAEVLHIAARGESITCLLLDNGVFGDTGGQMTATTTVGQRTKTDVDGRVPRASTATRSRSPTSSRRSPASRTSRAARSTSPTRSRGRAATCGRRSSRSSPARGSRWSRSSRCARPAGRSRPTRAPSTSATRVNLTYPLGELRPRPLTVDVRIHDMLTRAAAVAPHAHAARPSATSSAPSPSSTPVPTGPRTACAAEGVAPARPGGVVGPDRSRRPRRRLRRHEGSARSWRRSIPTSPRARRSPPSSTSRRAGRGRASDLRGAGARDRDRARAARSSSLADGWLDGASSTPLPRVGDRARIPASIFLTSGSTGVSKGAILSHRATWLRAIQRDNRRRRAGTQRRSGDVRPVPHGRLVLPRARVGGEPARAPRRTAPMPTSCSPPSSVGARAPCTHPRGVAAHPRRRRRVRHVVAARGAHRHVAASTSTSSTR